LREGFAAQFGLTAGAAGRFASAKEFRDAGLLRAARNAVKDCGAAWVSCKRHCGSNGEEQERSDESPRKAKSCGERVTVRI